MLSYAKAGRDVRIFSDVLERLRALLRRGREERDMTEEIQFHLDLQVEENLRHGMEPVEARRQAHLAFGVVDRVKEDVREARGVRMVEDVGKDLRYAFRAFRRSLGSTAAAVVTLAVGIGATTAIFTVVHGVLLRPLPIVDQDRVVVIGKRFPEQMPDQRLEHLPLSLREFRSWRKGSRSFEGMAPVHAYWRGIVWPWRTDDGAHLRTRSTLVGHGLFQVLGADRKSVV